MREHRISYKTPSGDVASGVMVCVTTVPAFHTPKLCLGLPVRLRRMPARRAFPACITRVNRHHRYSSQLRLVFDESTKLAEAPIVQSLPLLLAGLSPLADVRQVFQRNAEAGAFSSGNDCLRYAVVLMLLKPPLFAAHLAKTALCCFGADALQDGAPFGVAFAVLLDPRAGILVALAVSGDIDDAEINAKHAVRREQSRIIKVTHGAEIPLAAHEHQVGFALSVCDQSTLMVTADEGNLLAASQ